ncbi:PHP domain-containing protein [Anaeromyxobacter dehalogenans]|uniref:Phosphoesterase, PHP-like protein n=1 Tax=Anaeromyxobacter dehalogenans (strain 2CP-C) TaxID=290397 RepID=Q2IL22_ANADE|nr:PHP domain-containing protein [Anaeromyxobacter dehalogenans]ABC82352.1 phosphoesterase, PHP-like protein [Anaeromyxobacter dehalogenans 2CP-C]
MGEPAAGQGVNGKIDLHSHSKASDGQYPAGEVAERASAAGVGVWALCDHDTVAGMDDAAAAAARLGLRLVPGIELSAFLERREIHLLGHFVDPAHPRLRAFEDFLALRRRERMQRIVEKLGALGLRLQVEDIEKWSGGKTIGRPHVARALVELGAVATVKEAFDAYLGEGKPAYVQRYRLEADEAVRLVRAAGGTTTVAHPGVSKLERWDLERLRQAGVEGLEVYHVDHNPSVREKYLRIAEALDLVPTAGSDFHGEAVAPDRHLGDVSMPEHELQRLEARRP